MLYTLQDAAIQCNMHPETLRYYVLRKYVKPEEDSRGRVLFREEDIEQVRKYRKKHGRPKKPVMKRRSKRK